MTNEEFEALVDEFRDAIIDSERYDTGRNRSNLRESYALEEKIIKAFKDANKEEVL